MKKIGWILLKWYGVYLVVFYITLFLNKPANIALTIGRNWGMPSEIIKKVTIISLVISIPLYIGLNYWIKKKNNRNKELVKLISKKYKKIVELNSKYNFNELGNIKRTIIEKEYSHKSLDRADANSILLYYIENNRDNIREFILLAHENKELYDKYEEELSKIDEETTDRELVQINFSRKKFDKFEKKVIKDISYNEDVYNISIEVESFYTTYSGKNTYSKRRVLTYPELYEIYSQWEDGRKYKETARRERRYLTNEMRYDVLKRDGFKCQKCGATVADGVKLHVDHIVPVSKGGRTTLSNLQTLCDRCNLGKSDKEN